MWIGDFQQKNVLLDKERAGQVRTPGDSLDWECVCLWESLSVCNMPLGKSFTNLGAVDLKQPFTHLPSAAVAFLANF